MPVIRKRLPARRRKPGGKGEDLAARYLRRRGYRILERNVWCGRFEIDLIVRRKDTVVFVEVRSAASGGPVRPEDTVNARKREHIRQAARRWISRHPAPDHFYRFDVIAVVFPASGRPEITHIEDAFSMREAR
jgi:putative endonuclease